MSVSKLIQSQTEMLRNLEARLNEKVTPETLERWTAEIPAAQEDRVRKRIARLRAQKAAAIKRFDAAIAREEEALKLIAARMPKPGPDSPPERRGKGGRTPAGGDDRKKDDRGKKDKD
jgi:hypothetical protein